MNIALDSVKFKILPILRASGVLSASVFGSLARGESGKDSDVDLLIEFPSGKTLFDLVDLKIQLEEVLGVNVDIATPRALSPRIRPFIQNDLVPIL